MKSQFVDNMLYLLLFLVIITFINKDWEYYKICIIALSVLCVYKAIVEIIKEMGL